jgi:hypothetical protein
MRYDEARRLFVCDYCGSLAVLPPPPVYKETRTEPADRQYTLAAASTEKSVTDLPPAFLPLLNNEEHARHHFRYWFENNDLDDIPQPVGVRAIYRPYFAFDVNVETQVTLYDKFKVPFIDLHPETPKPDQVRLLYYIYTDYSPFFLAAFDDAGGYLDDQERLANAFNCAYQRPLTELIAPQLAPNISPSKAFMQVKIQIADMECRFGETLKSRRTEDYYINIYYLNWRRRLLYLPLGNRIYPERLAADSVAKRSIGKGSRYDYHLYRNGAVKIARQGENPGHVLLPRVRDENSGGQRPLPIVRRNQSEEDRRRRAPRRKRQGRNDALQLRGLRREMQYDPIRRMFVCPYCSAVRVLDQPPPEALAQEPRAICRSPFLSRVEESVKARTLFVKLDPERQNPKRPVRIKRIYLPYLLAKGIGCVNYIYSKPDQFRFDKTDDRYMQEFEGIRVPLFDITPYRKSLLGSFSTLPITTSCRLTTRWKNCATR